MGNRVFVTGIGAITPIGTGRDGLWKGALEGRRGVKAIDRFDASIFRSQVAGQVDDFDPSSLLSRREAQRTDRYSQFAIAAGQMAFDDSGYVPSGDDGDFGVWIGSALGGAAFAEGQFNNFYTKGPKAVSPIPVSYTHLTLPTNREV